MDKQPTPHLHPQPHPQPQTATHPHPYPYPYGPYPYSIRPTRSSRTTSCVGSRTTSCVLAFSFLLLILVAAPVVLFFLFRPHDPSVRVNAVKFPGPSVFSLSASVRNPSRDAFSHYDSTIKLLYGGDRREIGFMYIPAGEIGGGRTMNMDATFDVDRITTTTTSSSSSNDVELRVEMKGKVRVLRVFMHRVKAVAVCQVPVAAAVDGKVMGARCTSSSSS